MSLLIALVYDRVMAAPESACLRDWRRELLAHTHGDVLEIGAGTGASLPLYPPAVERIVLSEPDPHMRRRLERGIAPGAAHAVDVRGGSAERIEAETASFDCVFSSLVCCSVADLDATLAEIRRVLKPGGRFVFLEHVAAAEGSSRRRWQDRLNPLWRRLAGNCHLNRDTERAIVAAGLEIRAIQRESLRKAPPFIRPSIRGIAVRR